MPAQQKQLKRLGYGRTRDAITMADFDARAKAVLMNRGRRAEMAGVWAAAKVDNNWYQKI